MYALLLDVVAGLLRHVLTGAATWLIVNGIADQAQVNELIAGLALLIVSVGLLVWKKYGDRVLINTAAAAPAGTPVAEIKQDIKNGLGASALIPPSEPTRKEGQ